MSAPSLASGLRTGLYKAVSDARVGLFLETLLGSPYPEGFVWTEDRDEMNVRRCHTEPEPHI